MLWNRPWAKRVTDQLEDRAEPHSQITLLARGKYATLALVESDPVGRTSRGRPTATLPVGRGLPSVSRQHLEAHKVDLFYLKTVLVRYSYAILHLHQARMDRPRPGHHTRGGCEHGSGIPELGRTGEEDRHPPRHLHARAPEQGADASSRAQLLFHAFRAKRLGKPQGDLVQSAREIEADWYKVIHACLYQHAAGPEEFLIKDTYLWAFLKPISESPVTINYNFDDTIELMLEQYAKNTGSGLLPCQPLGP